jgi:hypothetical protein
MVRHLVRSLCYAAMAATLSLQGCGKPTPSSFDRPPHPAAAQDPATKLSLRHALPASRESSEKLPVARALLKQHDAEDPPRWITELLRDPDPSVRVQALDAWAQGPGASLDPVTYALVDPDESVRARAQELFERELNRR